MDFLGRGFKSRIHHNKLFQIFPKIELQKYSPRYAQEMKQLGLDIDRSARVSGRPGIPPFQGGKSVIVRLSLGKLLVNFLQVVKRTSTLLFIIP